MSLGGSSGECSGEEEAEESVSSLFKRDTDWSPSKARTSAESCFRRVVTAVDRCDLLGGGGLGKDEGGEELKEAKELCRELIPLEEGVEPYSRMETASSQLSSESYAVDLCWLNRTEISFDGVRCAG